MFSCRVPGAILVQSDIRVHSAGGCRDLARRVRGGEPPRAGPSAKGSLPSLPSPEHVSQSSEGTLWQPPSLFHSCQLHHFCVSLCNVCILSGPPCRGPCLSSASTFVPGPSSEPVLKLSSCFVVVGSWFFSKFFRKGSWG